MLKRYFFGRKYIVEIAVVMLIFISALIGFFVRDVTGNVISEEKISAFDHVKEEQIKVYDNNIVIELEDKELVWSKFSNTNSMDPFFDEGHNGLAFAPLSFEEIHVGDVVSFDYAGEIFVHRIVEIGYDGEWYALTKGDNSEKLDVGKRKFDDINSVYFGVIF
tara:strand:- start:3621 stop:4109 length:489 start_codon:yes stop_codon:yes gene_type:complete